MFSKPKRRRWRAPPRMVAESAVPLVGILVVATMVATGLTSPRPGPNRAATPDGGHSQPDTTTSVGPHGPTTIADGDSSEPAASHDGAVPLRRDADSLIAAIILATADGGAPLDLPPRSP